MKLKRIKDESGITLIELLLALALFSIITIIIISTLVMGMNSSKNVQKDVSLHDEANSIMTQLVRVIYIATSVVELNSLDDEKTTKIRVTNYQGEKTVLHLQSDQVLIDGGSIHSPSIGVLSEESSFKINDPTVVVELVFQDSHTGKTLQLKREISYVNVEGEE